MMELHPDDNPLRTTLHDHLVEDAQLFSENEATQKNIVASDENDILPIGTDYDPRTGQAEAINLSSRKRRTPQRGLEARREQPAFEQLSSQQQQDLQQKAATYERLLQAAVVTGAEKPPRSEILLAAHELGCHENTVRYQLERLQSRIQSGKRVIDVLIRDYPDLW